MRCGLAGSASAASLLLIWLGSMWAASAARGATPALLLASDCKAPSKVFRAAASRKAAFRRRNRRGRVQPLTPSHPDNKDPACWWIFAQLKA